MKIFSDIDWSELEKRNEEIKSNGFVSSFLWMITSKEFRITFNDEKDPNELV